MIKRASKIGFAFGKRYIIRYVTYNKNWEMFVNRDAAMT